MLFFVTHFLRVIVREIRAKSKNLERWRSADLLHTNFIGRLGGLVDKYTKVSFLYVKSLEI